MGREREYEATPILQQGAAKLPTALSLIPWGHQTVTLSKMKNIQSALFYMEQTVQHTWSKSVFRFHSEAGQIDIQGKTANNFGPRLLD